MPDVVTTTKIRSGVVRLPLTPYNQSRLGKSANFPINLLLVLQPVQRRFTRATLSQTTDMQWKRGLDG